jgi:hypothetical protein
MGEGFLPEGRTQGMPHMAIYELYLGTVEASGVEKVGFMESRRGAI